MRPPTPQYSPSTFSRTQMNVDVLGTFAGQRTRDALQQAHGTKIDVLVKALANGQQHAPKRDMVGNTRIANRANQDGVECARLQHLQRIGRHHRSLAKIALGAPVVVLGFELQAAVKFGERFESFTPSVMTSDPIPSAGHYRNVVVPHAIISSLRF